MRVLIIADYLPYPLVGGDRIRVYNLLRRVARRHDVSLVAFLPTPADAGGIHHLQQFCAKVEVVPLHRLQRRSRLAKLAAMVRFALAGRPMELTHLFSHELSAKIRALASTVDFDIVQIEHSQMGLYLEALPKAWRGKSILMLHNFTSQQHQRISRVEQRWSRRLRAWASSVAMRTWEPQYAEHFDRCATVSEDDRQLLRRANPRLKVEVIPNGVDIESFQVLPVLQERAARSLVFVGNMGYWPCADAVLNFCRDIYPLIYQEIGTIDLWIVGRDPGPEVLALHGGNVHVTGLVDDVVPYYRQSAVCVVPLRAGGGTRLKILEAMALGRPVVSTTIGAEGLDVVDGKHLLIADTAEQFAEKTVRLLREPELYQHLTSAGRQLVEARYGWDGIADRLMTVYEEMAAPPTEATSEDNRVFNQR